jgi:hypothetical protein
MIELETPKKGGHAVRVLRCVRPRCRECGGLGLLYSLNEHRFTITIRECECVKYEIHYIPLVPTPESTV